MIKFYDINKNYIGLIDSYKDAYTTETLSTGFKTLCFKIPCVDEMLVFANEENYVETIDYSYVIKEILMEDN